MQNSDSNTSLHIAPYLKIVKHYNVTLCNILDLLNHT